MSPDYFLSQQGIKYDGSGFKGTPQQIVANLIRLTAAYDSATYRTKGFVYVPPSPATFDRSNTEKLDLLMRFYGETLREGYPGRVYKAVDAVNEFRMVISGAELVPPPEIQIVAHQDSNLGESARYLYGVYAEGDISEFFDLHGDAIRSYAKSL